MMRSTCTRSSSIHGGRGVLTVATRVGLFRSRGRRRGGGADCLSRRPAPAGCYCRSVAYAPDDPQILYLGAGEGFEGDAGMLFLSRDGGENWSVPAYGLKLKSTGVRRCNRFALSESCVFCEQVWRGAEIHRSWIDLGLQSIAPWRLDMCSSLAVG